jgi:hypothetical protein
MTQLRLGQLREALQCVVVEAHVRAQRISHNACQRQLVHVPPKRACSGGRSRKLREVHASAADQLGGFQHSRRHGCGCARSRHCSAGKQVGHCGRQASLRNTRRLDAAVLVLAEHFVQTRVISAHHAGFNTSTRSGDGSRFRKGEASHAKADGRRWRCSRCSGELGFQVAKLGPERVKLRVRHLSSLTVMGSSWRRNYWRHNGAVS